jgi:hypothetical protein
MKIGNCWTVYDNLKESIVDYLQKQYPILEQQVYYAFEKLDGTNLGIHCNGASIFGRWQWRQVFGASYYQYVAFQKGWPARQQNSSSHEGTGCCNMVGVTSSF